jgi:hypothetical protein
LTCSSTTCNEVLGHDEFSKRRRPMKNTYYCTVDYQTEGGEAGTACYYIKANDIETAGREARDRAVRDRRRHVMKVYGGDTSLIVPRR